MAFEEKVTWVNASVTVLVAAIYWFIVGRQVGAAPVAAIAYQVPMLVAMGAMIVLTIVGVIVTSIGSAIGAAIRAQITGEGSFEEATADIDRKDERDVHIDWRGDRVGFYVTSGLMIGVLALAMLRYDTFWIANAMFASFVVAGLASSATKIAAYRRGF